VEVPGEAEWDARTVVTVDLLSRVRAGDGEAFRALTGAHRGAGYRAHSRAGSQHRAMERLHVPNGFFRIRRLREGMRAWQELWPLLADSPKRLASRPGDDG